MQENVYIVARTRTEIGREIEREREKNKERERGKINIERKRQKHQNKMSQILYKYFIFTVFSRKKHVLFKRRTIAKKKDNERLRLEIMTKRRNKTKPFEIYKLDCTMHPRM